MLDSKIVLYPDPILRQISVPLESSDLQWAKDDLLPIMVYAMADAGGIGLAAPQIGISKRVLIIKKPVPGKSEPFTCRVLINPTLIRASDERILIEEGCLSLPGIRVRMERSRTIDVGFINLNGEEFVETFDEIESVVIQHEIDHLDGKLIVDGILRGELPPPDRDGL